MIRNKRKQSPSANQKAESELRRAEFFVVALLSGYSILLAGLFMALQTVCEYNSSTRSNCTTSKQ